MITVHYLCAIDRLVTLQSISLTFWNDGICCSPPSENRVSKVFSLNATTKTDDLSRDFQCCCCLFKNANSGEISDDSSVKNSKVCSPSVIHMCDIHIPNIPTPTGQESRSASFRL